MGNDNFAGQIAEQYRLIGARLLSLDEKVTTVNNTVIKIESTMVTKDLCESRRDKVYQEVRRVSKMKFLIQGPLTVLGAVIGGIIGFITFGKLGGK